MLDEAAGRYEDVRSVTQLDHLEQRAPRHQSERTSGELQRVNPFAHRFENVFEGATTERRIVRTANLGDANRPRLVRTIVQPYERECALLDLLIRCGSHDGTPHPFADRQKPASRRVRQRSPALE